MRAQRSTRPKRWLLTRTSTPSAELEERYGGPFRMSMSPAGGGVAPVSAPCWAAAIVGLTSTSCTDTLVFFSQGGETNVMK